MQLSSFDDEEFSVHAARLLTRGELLELIVKLSVAADQLVNRLAKETYDPERHDILDETVERKRRQIRWIHAKLAQIKDHNRQLEARKRSREAILKMDRTALFHRCFVELCRKELSTGDFKRFCQIAEQEMERLLVTNRRKPV